MFKAPHNGFVTNADTEKGGWVSAALPDQTDRDRSFLHEVGARLAHYLDDARNGSRTVTSGSDPAELIAALLPYTQKHHIGLSRTEIINLIDLVLQHSVCTGHPGFLNQLYGGQIPEAIAAEWVATVASTSMATFEISPMASVLESLFFARLRELAGYPAAPHHPYSGATLVPGGSNGNMVALLTARNILFPKTRDSGMAGGPKLALFVSEESHYSYGKAANIVGIGLDNVVPVPCDHRGRMLPDALNASIHTARELGIVPFFVGATAGTTVKGACDPLVELADVAHQHGIWFHVDAALGGSHLFSPKCRSEIQGIERSDSFIWDAHKLMNAPLVASVLMCQDPSALFRSGTGGGEDYLFHNSRDDRGHSWDSGESSLQCGRRPDILKIALMWLGLGEEEWARRIEAALYWARRLEIALAADRRFELVAPVESSSVCFRVHLPVAPSNESTPSAHTIGAERNECDPQIELRRQLNATGRFMVNYSYDASGRAFFRLVTINHLTTGEHYEQLFTELLKLAGYSPTESPFTLTP